MKRTRTHGPGLAQWVLLALWAACAQAAAAEPWQEQSQRIRADIAARARELGALKLDVQRSFATLRRSEIDAREDSDKWQRSAKQESDSRMRAVLLGFSDGSTRHAQFLGTIEGVLADTARIGEDMESQLSLAASYQDVLDAMARGGKPSAASVRDAYDMLLLSQKRLASSAAALGELHKVMAMHAGTLEDFDRKVKALLADIGNPRERVKQYEKELVKSQLSLNGIQAQHLGIVASHAGQLFDMLGRIAAAEKLQMRFVDSIR